MGILLHPRRDLQYHCKELGMPAKYANAFIAEDLTDLQNESQVSVRDSAAIVSSSRGRGRVKKILKADELGLAEIDELTSCLARSTLLNDPSLTVEDFSSESKTQDDVTCANFAPHFSFKYVQKVDDIPKSNVAVSDWDHQPHFDISGSKVRKNVDTVADEPEVGKAIVGEFGKPKSKAVVGICTVEGWNQTLSVDYKENSISSSVNNRHPALSNRMVLRSHSRGLRVPDVTQVDDKPVTSKTKARRGMSNLVSATEKTSEVVEQAKYGQISSEVHLGSEPLAFIPASCLSDGIAIGAGAPSGPGPVKSSTKWNSTRHQTRVLMKRNAGVSKILEHKEWQEDEYASWH